MVDRKRVAVGVVIGTAVVAVLIAVAAAGGAGDSIDPAAGPCADFVIAVNDLQDGLLTDAEFRQQMVDVVDDAEGTEVEGLSRDVLAAVTTGTSDEASDAMRAMAGPCNSLIEAELND